MAGCCGRFTRPFSTPGSTPRMPAVRSAAFFGAGMGVLHGSDPNDAPVELLERFLDFMLRP